MDFQILYTDPALADLEEIIAWSSAQHPESTEQFGTALLNHIDQLKRFPRLGAPVKGFPGVRCPLHSPLRIYYRVVTERKRIDILEFRHTSRKPSIF